MKFFKRAAVQVAIGVLATGAAVAAPVAAQADTAPYTVTMTVTPSTTVVGGQVTVVAKSVNNTSSTMAGSLGIENPGWAREKITGVYGHCQVRNVIQTIYCGSTQVPPGGYLQITVTLTVTAAGTDTFTAYGSITGSNSVYASATLTAS